MKIINFDTVKAFAPSPEVCVEWVKDAFLHKYDANLPPKISIKLPDNVFMNTMPCYLPYLRRMGVKVVSRYPSRVPSLQSDLLLYDSESGRMLAFMDGLWITTMRTGAVAALSILTLQKSNANRYAFLGLGNTARATLLCLLSQLKGQPVEINLLQYKDQTELFMNRFKEYSNLNFNIFSSADKLIAASDVVVSCVTAADQQFASDTAYQSGILVVPVHTRGFQNCDLFFDKIYADDTEHVRGFKYFDKFNCFDEFSNVLLKKNMGRVSDIERILVYNIGIALHDIYFASKIYDILSNIEDEVPSCSESRKFWV